MQAVTTAFDPSIPLEQVAGADGLLFVRGEVGFAGRGEVARIPAGEVEDFLAAISHHDEVGDTPGPIAFGALPCDPSHLGEMIVPALSVGRDATGRSWITRIGDHELDLAPPSPADAAGFNITQEVPIDTYLAAVTAARDAVRAGSLTKVVIARPIRVTADRPMDIAAVLARLRVSFGSSYRFSIDGLVGASPELLVEVDGQMVRSHPLAGTTTRTGDPSTDARLAAELVASVKNQVEHRIVIEVVHDALLPWVSYLDWEPEPSIVPVANVQHLGSAVEGRLSQPQPSVLTLARALAPTPALGGHPREAALELIAATEGFARGRYGGAVGWVNAHGQGTWAVTIRCAEFDADRRSARLVAGGGIVADSDPLAELAETQAKFQAMLSALVRA